MCWVVPSQALPASIEILRAIYSFLFVICPICSQETLQQSFDAEETLTAPRRTLLSEEIKAASEKVKIASEKLKCRHDEVEKKVRPIELVPYSNSLTTINRPRKHESK